MKTNFFVIFLLVALLMTGCNSEMPSDNKHSMVQGTIPNNNESQSVGTPNQSNESARDIMSINTELSNLNLQGVSGKVQNIAVAKDNNIIVFTDKMYLYDLANNSVMASTAYMGSKDMKLFPLNSGYAFISYGKADDSNTTNIGEEVFAGRW